MLFVEVVIYSEKSFLTTLPVLAKRSHHPPLHKEGKFYYLFGLLFIAENKIKAFVYTISQSATLTALFTKESLAIRKVFLDQYYDALYLCRLSLFFTAQLYHKK